MRAIAVHHDESTPRLIEKPRPTPEAGEVLVRTLRVGIDGTDHGVIDSSHGGFPDGADHQVLGHEAVGIVERISTGSRTSSDDGVVAADGTALSEGQVVVPTVRRPPADGPNEYFSRDQPDMAPPGAYVERGIEGEHGYMAEYFTSHPRYLVPVPETMAETGFLIEPISNSEKALELAYASRSTFDWNPESAIVLGNGPLGLLTLAMVDDRFARTYCLGRRDRPDTTIDVIERLDATYVDSRQTPVDRLSSEYEAMDLVYEATGYAKHAFQTLDALGPNGVGALVGIPDDWSFDIDGGRLHREFVLQNKAIVGSVNSHVPHFQAAIETLRGFPDWFIDALITDIHPPEDVEAAFETGPDRIKTVIEFGTI